MSDLVQRLRSRETCRNGGGLCTDKGMAIPGFCTCKEAASEIEKLQAENLQLTKDFILATADKQLALREVERLRKKLARVGEALKDDEEGKF